MSNTASQHFFPLSTSLCGSIKDRWTDFITVTRKKRKIAALYKGSIVEPEVPNMRRSKAKRPSGKKLETPAGESKQVLLTHSVRLQQIQEKIQLFHNIILLSSALRTQAKTTFITECLDECSRAGGEEGGRGVWSRTCWAALSDSTANSTDRFFRDWRRVPQVLCEEAKEGRAEVSEPRELPRNIDSGRGSETLSCQTYREAQRIWNLINISVPPKAWRTPLILKYLSSLPNMRRSDALSFERSAIFSALSRSLWKLLWIFLISSRLVENWAWMSAGR